METLLFGPSAVTEALEMKDVIEALRDAFMAHHRGDSVMPAKSYIDLPQYNGDFRAMPAYVDDAAGLKWVNSHPDNPEKHGLPTVMGVMIYSEPETAYPVAILDGTTLTRYRTGAVAGLATDLLANKKASSLGIIGAGAQAHAQLEAISKVRDIERVVINDIDEEAMESFIEKEDRGGIDFVKGTGRETASCDILSTITPSRDPIVKSDWIKPGIHINAMGADAEGKQELEAEILKRAKVVVDDWEQCSHSGEINNAVCEGVFTRSDIYAELAETVAGEKTRESSEDITIFDSTGLAIQDVATARLIYNEGEEYAESFKLVSD